MAIHDPPPARPETVQQGSDRIREFILIEVDRTEEILSIVHGIVTVHGRAAIDAVLGADAAGLAAVYESMKESIEIPEIDRTVPDLPV